MFGRSAPDGLAEPQPAIAVGAEAEALQRVAGWRVGGVAEHLPYRTFLARLRSEIHGDGFVGQVGEGEHRATRCITMQRQHRSHARVDVLRLTDAELGTVTQVVQGALEPP